MKTIPVHRCPTCGKYMVQQAGQWVCLCGDTRPLQEVEQKQGDRWQDVWRKVNQYQPEDE